MAANQGTIYVKLDLDTSSFDKGLDQSADKAEKSGGFLKRAFEFATGGAILGGLNAVKDSVLGVAKSMIDSNAEFETYQTQFGVLLGSADEAKKRLDELAKFGANTPFELPELVRADKVLTSFGIHSEDLLTIVGDVASGTGASFEDMALLMGKFSAGATGEALSRFQELGVATKQELAAMGIEFDKAGSMTTPVAEAMPILEQLMKEKFGGMMTAQSQTFNGMMSNLQDWVGGTLRTIGQPIFEVLKDKLGVLLAFLSSPEVKAAIEAFAQGLVIGIGNTIDFISNTVIPAFIIAWNTLAPVITAIIPVISQVMAAFASGGESSTQLGSTITWLQGIWQSLTPVIDSVVNVIRSIVETVFTAIQQFLEANGDDIHSFIDDTWTSIKDIITTLVKLINATIVPLFNGIANFIRAHGDSIRDYLGNTWTIIKSIINIALAIITGVIKTFLAVVQGDWQGAWNAIKTMFGTVWENIKTLLSAALGNIKILLSVAWDAIKTVASAAWNYIKTNIIEAAWNGIKSSINTKVNEVKTALSTAWDSVKSTVESKWDSIKEAIGTKFSAAKGKIDGVISDIKGALTGAWDGIKSGVASAWEGIASAAGNAFSGITGKIKGIVNQAIDMVNRLIDAYNEVASTLGLGTLDHISRLASGTNNFRGGLALVGENGPELVTLPRGSQVTPSAQTQQMLRRQLTVNNYYNTPISPAQQLEFTESLYSSSY